MILDAHVHLPSSNHAKEKEESFLSYFPDRASAVAYLRRTGIGGVVFTTWEGVWSDTEEELENANAEALEIYESDREFFYPGASIHPAFPKTSEKWLSLFREKGLVWVGELVHYRAGRGDYDNAEWIRLFELCCEYGMIVQLHFSPSVIRLAKRLPSLRSVRMFCSTSAALPAACASMRWNPPASRSGRTGFCSARISPSTNRKPFFCVRVTPFRIRRSRRNSIPAICFRC